jgi:hypothetical protein
MPLVLTDMYALLGKYNPWRYLVIKILINEIRVGKVCLGYFSLAPVYYEPWLIFTSFMSVLITGAESTVKPYISQPAGVISPRPHMYTSEPPFIKGNMVPH